MIQAKYFPVDPKQKEFKAGFHKLGTDFGNGYIDTNVFQFDNQHYFYQKEKIDSPLKHLRIDGAEENYIINHILEWAKYELLINHNKDYKTVGWNTICENIQEDLVIHHRYEHGFDKAIMVDVRLPTYWNPNSIIGNSFKEIHQPVNGIGHCKKQNQAWLDMMMERGPWVRFNWTLTTSDKLDGFSNPRPEWEDAGSGFLRVERQVLVPFPMVQATLFVIRPYVYPFFLLTEEQRLAIKEATAHTDGGIAEYKDWNNKREHIWRLLKLK